MHNSTIFLLDVLTYRGKVLTSIYAVIIHWGMFTKSKYIWNVEAAWLVALNFNNVTQKQLHLFPKKIHTFPFSNLTTTHTSEHLIWIPQTHGKWFQTCALTEISMKIMSWWHDIPVGTECPYIVLFAKQKWIYNVLGLKLYRARALFTPCKQQRARFRPGSGTLFMAFIDLCTI